MLHTRILKIPWVFFYLFTIYKHICKLPAFRLITYVPDYDIINTFRNKDFESASLGMGVSPIEYVLDRKIKNAIKLLLMGRSIKDTARTLSFYDEYYFSKQFKRRVGCSPAQYAKTHNLHSS